MVFACTITLIQTKGLKNINKIMNYTSTEYISTIFLNKKQGLAQSVVKEEI